MSQKENRASGAGGIPSVPGLPRTIVGGLATHVTILATAACGALGWIGSHASDDHVQRLAAWFIFIITTVLGLAMIIVTVWRPSVGMLAGENLVQRLAVEEKLKRTRTSRSSLEPSTPPTPPAGARKA